MKSLKLHFESLLDDEDIFFDSGNEKKLVKEWIKDNYKINGNLTISDDFVVDCSGNVAVRNTSITSLTNGLFRWGVIGGGFNCNHCENLKTLEGAPKKTSGCFDCGRCDKLETLEGAPEEVGGYFNCSNCKNLKSLEGAPRIVGSGFYCNHCENLKTLEGAPEKVEGVFNCTHCNELKSLEGAPEKVGKGFDCRKCINLEITDSDRKKYKIIY